MSAISRFIGELSPRQRTGLLAGVVMIVLCMGALAWWSFRPTYGVLFSELSERDGAAVVQELDKLKVPYRFGADGRTILVNESVVHKTRMTLMGRQLPLHGAVGFELFNNAEFGASDFIQKVNYQRALQGELTRTISSIEQVQTARVHLALPEQGLFRKEAQKAKASVTVVMKQGQAMTPGQVLGIQRLVAASVPDIRVDDVTVLDQQGVTLSRLIGDEAVSGLAGASPLEAKVDVERQLSAKATQVLDRMFGAGASLVTVDVVVNRRQSKVTTEEVLPAANLAKDQLPTGVVVRERTVTKDGSADGGKTSGSGSSSQEVDYATGKRIEQVVSPSGDIARINVAVVLKTVSAPEDLTRAKDLVAAAVGAQSVRGDVVAVHLMSTMQSKGVVAEPIAASHGVPQEVLGGSQVKEEGSPVSPKLSAGYWIVGAACILLVMTFVWRTATRRAQEEQRRLTVLERQSLLNSVQTWLTLPERQHEA